MNSVSGRSFKNGIILRTDDVSVKCYYDNNNEIKVDIDKEFEDDEINYKNKIEDYLTDIPLIRGIMTVSNFKIFFGFVFIDILNILSKTKNITETNSIVRYILLGISLLFTVIIIGVMIYLVKDFKSTLKYHGAEHKVVNAYESNKAITVDNIDKCSRVHTSCGTIYAIFFGFTMIMFLLIIPYKTIVYLLSIAISYELFIVDDPEIKWYSKYFYKVGLFIQKNFTTLEPEQKHLIIAKECMLNLLDNLDEEFEED